MVCIHFPIGMTLTGARDTWTFKRGEGRGEGEGEKGKENGVRGGHVTYGDLCKIAARYLRQDISASMGSPLSFGGIYCSRSKEEEGL